MNFVYLSHKYLGVDCLMEDRTYGGLLWPSGAGEKPSYEVFESFQKEEDRLGRVEKNAGARLETERRERHRQAEHKALQDIIPYEQKIADHHEQVRADAFEQRCQALELQHALESRQQIDHCWKEISKADDIVTKEAQQYLEDTAHMLAWDQQKIPAEVLSKREEAHKRIFDSKTVYANWATLRASEMPSREELQAAIQAGGDQLKRLQDICKGVQLRYPRPKRNHYI